MNLEQLEYIVATAEAGSLSKAAVKLNVTISTVSQAVSNLEGELGVKLFHRHRQGIAETVEGREIIEKAKDALLKINEIKIAASHYGSLDDKELRVGCSPIVWTMLLGLHSKMQQAHPLTIMKMSVKNNDQIANDLLLQRDDLALAVLFDCSLFVNPKLQVEPLFVSRFGLVASRHSPYASFPSLGAEQLRSIPLAFYKDDGMKRLYERFEQQFGALNVVLETDHSATVIQLLSSGEVAGIGLEQVYSRLPGDIRKNFVHIEFEFDFWDRVEVALVYSKEKVRSGKFRKLLAEVKGILHPSESDGITND